MLKKAGRYHRQLFAAICVIVTSSGLFAVSSDANSTNLQPQALDFVGIYALRELDPNISGAGINFGIVSRSYTYNGTEPQNDYAVAAAHPCFASKDILFYDDGRLPLGISPHAAAVASILLGEDANGFAKETGSFYYQGVCPHANADIFEFRHFVRDVIFAQNAIDIDVLTMSLGSQFDDWWSRGINRFAEASGTSVVAAIGNGTDVNDPLLYPGAGPNVLAVGVVDSISGPNDLMALDNFSQPSPRHSSSGPTRDGRCKPDIVAPANCFAATTDANKPYGLTGDWSSFSTPIVAGTIGLLVQKAKNDPNLQSALWSGGNCVFKAIVMNAAEKLPSWHKGLTGQEDDHETPLDHLQGAGMLDAAAAYQQLVTNQWDNNFLTPDVPNIYYLKADASTGHITATVVWNRHYQDRYPFESLPNKDVNLRLELWAIDANNSQNDRLLDYSDSFVDNVEHIYFPVQPKQTDYAIKVSFSSTANADANTIEQYGLAWNADN